MTGPFVPPAGMPPGGAPGQGGQQQSHPTVQYGLPGGPPAQIIPPNQRMPRAGEGGYGQGYPVEQIPQAPQMNQGYQGNPTLPPSLPQPASTQPGGQYGAAPSAAPYGQPGQYPQGYAQGAPQQGQGFQQGQGPRRIEPADDMILDGPNVPTELRGRTFGQVKQIYGALASEWMGSRARQPGQQNGQPNGQQQQAPAQRQQPQGRPVYTQGEGYGDQQQPPANEVQEYWRNPAEFTRRAIREEAGAIMAPAVQHAAQTQIAQARQVAMQGIPDFAELEGEMMQTLATADAQALSNPAIWQGAADLARGRLMARGQYRGVRQQPQQRFMGGPGASVPAQVVPLQPPQPHQFFTEAPTPPSQQDWGQGQMQFTQEDAFYASKFGMNQADYMAWKGAQTQRRV
jgi:hypothetical protein